MFWIETVALLLLLAGSALVLRIVLEADEPDFEPEPLAHPAVRHEPPQRRAA